jgi:tellurite resistance protein TehA-like permease
VRLPLGMAGPDGSLALHRPAGGAAIRNLNPGYFALVMATGIVSRAVGADGSARLSGILLVLTIVCYVVLVVAYGWRLVGYRREFLADLAGVVLYVIVATLVLTSLLQYPVRPAELTPAYWVFMGATAISVLAGAQILLPADPLVTAARPVMVGMCVILWAFGTWLIPFLLGMGVWRHLIRKVKLSYEPGLWSIVFPVGMYGVASRELGKAVGVSWLVTLGSDEMWFAFAVWAVVFLAMLGSFVARPLRSPARHQNDAVGTGG